MARKHGLATQHQSQEWKAQASPGPSSASPSPRRRQILATRLAAAQPATAPPPVAPHALIHRRRRALPEVVILRTKLEALTPIESTVLQALARFGSATPGDIVRNVRGGRSGLVLIAEL